MKITVKHEIFPLAETFVIARGAKSQADVLTVEIEDGGILGRGESVPYARFGETLETVRAQIEGFSGAWEALQTELPAGAARNALDCAYWDYQAKRDGIRLYDRFGVGPMQTAFTLSLDTPETMHKAALANAQRPLLKIKLGTDQDLARLEAVRSGAPKARLIVDANEGWDRESYLALLPHLERLRVDLVEQPFAEDHMLTDLPRPVPICADESCHTRADLNALSGKYDVVNIKLDKTGGLTEALALQKEARAMGFGIMVGCMVSSSLSMAPAMILAQEADYVDLDGPLLLAEDRENAIVYEGSTLYPPALWG